MKKYQGIKAILILVIILFSVKVLAVHYPTAYFTPVNAVYPFFSNIIIDYNDGYTQLQGKDSFYLGGFYDGVFLYSPTDDISDGVKLDWGDPLGDGWPFSYCKYDQLFMGTVIVSENGQAESGGAQFNTFNHIHFSKTMVNQNQDYTLNGTPNAGFGGNPYFDRGFDPHYPLTGNMETYMKVSDGAGITITQRTAQFQSSKWSGIDPYNITWNAGDFWSVSGSTPSTLENTVIKNYTITNNTDMDKTDVYITQRLDVNINTSWTDGPFNTLDDTDYEIYYFTSANDGEFDDMAGFQYPVSGIAENGYFGYAYDTSYTSTYTGVGVKILGNDPTPASFKIIPYEPGYIDLDNNGIADNRLVKYGIWPVNWPSNPKHFEEYFLRPYNPMEYFDSSAYYNDFVDPGTVDANVTSPGNYAIALTAGPFDIDAGKSVNIAFAICAAAGTSKTDMLTKLDTILFDSNSTYKGTLAAQDLNPPSMPAYRSVYETYDTSSDTVLLKLKWDTQNLTENDTLPTPSGSGYNLYMTTGVKIDQDSKFARININNAAAYTQVFGALANAPTSYDMYISTSWSIGSINLDQHDSYLFALSANDEKWYDGGTNPGQNYYFNESDPVVQKIYLFPAVVNVECDFAYTRNANFIRVSYTSPSSFERDLDYYSIFRVLGTEEEVEKVYFQAGVYKEIQALTTPAPIKVYLNDEDYIIYSDDLVFNNDNVLDDVFINNANVKLIVENFYLQKFSETSPLTISDTDATPVSYVLTLDSLEKSVKYDTNTLLYYWDKQDDYGLTYYQASNGTTSNTFPSSCSNSMFMYAMGTPESIIDYTELEGDSTYYYNATKSDLLGNTAGKQGYYGIITYPNHPINLKAEDENKGIKLTWDPPAGDIYRYYVYRCSTSGVLNSSDPLNEDYVSKIGAVLDTGATTPYEFIDNYIDSYSTYYYFITAFNRANSTESSASNVAYVTKYFDHEKDLAKAHAVPNPYFYGSSDASKENGNIVFIDLTSKADIYIYTIRGNLVKKIEHTSTSSGAYGDGAERWDLLNDSGNQLATGLYFYLIKNPDNKDDVKKGKIAIIR